MNLVERCLISIFSCLLLFLLLDSETNGGKEK